MSSRHSWRNVNGASSGARSRRSSAAAPITVTAFVDWKAQIHNARAAGIMEPRAQAGRTLKNVARIVDKVLTGRVPSARFRVAFRFYHGWHKGFEETESRKAMTGPGQPHIKLLSHQQLISEGIAQSHPDSLLPVADLRLLALEQVHRHMANHPDIVSSIASTNPTFVFSECHVQPPMQLVLDTPVRTHRSLK